MSIFGMLDSANIPTNPYFIEKGEYEAEVTEAKFGQKNDGTRQLQIKFTITDESSEYFDKSITKYFDLVDPEMTEEQFAMLPADEKKRIMSNMSALKRTLCGNDARKDQPGLGVDPDDLDSENWNPETLVGTKVVMGISNGGQKNEYTNWKWANLRDE